MADTEMMKFDIEKKDQIATLTINQPKTLNAITGSPSTFGPEYDKYWRGLMQELKYDPDIRVIVLTGAG
ncbi:MAG: enoyl-CoA hydratase/isomerase family protein, partial [candidate division Zixibacteria bacterium]|nr:enoyl-CoA hydratase/isomerase family protein [candidate division Zixibacteria bacterium]